MPNERCRTEGDLVSRLLDPPAKIDVVAGLVVLWIESTDAFKRPAVPRHVTAGNVFGDGVRQEDMTRSARRGGDAGLHPIPRRRRNIRSTYSRIFAAQERAQEIIEPIRIGHAVRVGVRENFAFCDGRAVVSSVTQTVIGLVEVTDVRKAGGNFARLVSRSIV